LAIQCDGRILAAGSATNSTGNLDFAIARYLRSLVKSDFDFDGDSIADVAIWEPSSGMWFINNSSDGSTSSMGWGRMVTPSYRQIMMAKEHQLTSSPLHLFT